MPYYYADAARRILAEHFAKEMAAETQAYKRALVKYETAKKSHADAMKAHEEAMQRHAEETLAWKATKNWIGFTRVPKPQPPVPPAAPPSPQQPESVESRIKPFMDVIENNNKLCGLRNDWSRAPIPETFNDVVAFCLMIH